MKEKRIGPDRIVNLISGISILSWIVLALILVAISIRNPSSSLTASVRPSFFSGAGDWAGALVNGLLFFLVLISLSGIIFNKMRLRRKTDRMRLSLIFSAIFAVAGIFISAFGR
jgi:hypothetical protein